MKNDELRNPPSTGSEDSPPAPADRPPDGDAVIGPDPIVEPDQALPPLDMAGLTERMRQAAARAGWTSLLPVQARAIPYILAKRDLMTQSRTGSGKTGAFMLPILERIDAGLDACQVLILVPTRELALQVGREAEMLAGGSGIRSISVYGGTGYGPQLDAFRAGAHIVIGTPGRILDHLLRGSLKLDRLTMLVFDEADRLLSMGFYPDMCQVKRYLPSRRINAYMFSATFPQYVLNLAGEFLHRPEMLSLSRDHVHVAETAHIYYPAPPMEKDRCLVGIIEIENPASAFIFCNTRNRVHYVTVVLQRFGYDADELSADVSQNQREKVMARMRQGGLRFLVATDVAARGIDIPDVSHVFLYETPEDPEAYIHRAGRTGRAGARGTAISLVSGMEEIELKEIARRFGIELEARELPTEADVEATISQRVTALLEANLRGRDKLRAERMKRFLPLARGLGECEEEQALLAMLLDDFYQQTLGAVPPQPSPPPAHRPAAPRERGPAPRENRPRRRR